MKAVFAPPAVSRPESTLVSHGKRAKIAEPIRRIFALRVPDKSLIPAAAAEAPLGSPPSNYATTACPLIPSRRGVIAARRPFADRPPAGGPHRRVGQRFAGGHRHQRRFGRPLDASGSSSGVQQRRCLAAGELTSDMARPLRGAVWSMPPVIRRKSNWSSYPPPRPIIPCPPPRPWSKSGSCALAYDIQAGLAGFMVGLIGGMQHVLSGAGGRHWSWPPRAIRGSSIRPT